MDSMYLIIVGIMMVLAIAGLVVGVANDAVNFLNSALGSKVAPRYVIMIVASVGILVGAITSSGMMEVARSGVFHPEMFTFADVMMLFLSVMFMNVILLDVFNTLGLPTSTTVSLVFGLLGAAVSVSVFKIANSDLHTIADLASYINTGKAMAIISGILLSVAIAFVCGTVVMYVTRLIFSYRYQRKIKSVGAIWCGIAVTAISYFAIFKGLKGSSLMDPEVMAWMDTHILTLLLILFVGWSIVMAILAMFKINILKITVLAGTLSLALAFAGNDLVNFIGVFVAGFDSYENVMINGSGDVNTMMGSLNGAVTTHPLILIISGVIMVLTLWFSKKSQTVADTEINLARQDAGAERFGSTSVSRAMVRCALNCNKTYEKYTPKRIQRFVASRFVPVYVPEGANKAPFDLIRATVNLTVASILISMATSLQLPLSTTYVTFMVAMGSSLADRAWGRESAVYRITGVLTVIAGWFLTALIAFTIAFLIALGLMWGGMIAVVIFAVVCGYMLIQSSIIHNRKVKKEAEREAEEQTEAPEQTVIQRCVREVAETMLQVTTLYRQTLVGLFNEDRKLLKQMVRESEELYRVAHERKHEMLPTLLKLQENYIETGHYYVQVVDYINEVTKALVHITRPSFDHINNNHEGLNKEQVADLELVNEKVGEIYQKINVMLENNDFSQLDEILQMRDKLFDALAAAIKSQIKRVKAKASTTRSSILYLTIINETKTMVLQTRNLLKSQRYFISGD